MSNRRRQNLRANDPEYGLESQSVPVDDTLAEEYQHVNPAGPDDVPVRRRGRGGRRRGNARTSNGPRPAPREPCGKCHVRPRQGTAIVTCLQCNVSYHDKSSCTKGVLLDGNGSFTCYSCNPAQELHGRGRQYQRPRPVSESFLGVPDHQSTFNQHRSDAELLMADIQTLENGGDISVTIEEVGVDDENLGDDLDKILEKLRKVGLSFERREMEKDGNCWWSSIADQIRLNSLDFPSTHEELRFMVVSSADFHPNRHEWIEILFNNDQSAWESWKRFQLRNGTFTDEWGIIPHLTAFYLDVNIHLVGTSNTDSNPFTVIASSNNLDTEFWVGYTQDYEGLKDGHYDSLKVVGTPPTHSLTGVRLESGTAEMSADSVVLDSDLGLFSDGSDSVFDDMGLCSDGDDHPVETDESATATAPAVGTSVEVVEPPVVGASTPVEITDVVPDHVEMVTEPKQTICKKGKGN